MQQTSDTYLSTTYSLVHNVNKPGYSPKQVKNYFHVPSIQQKSSVLKFPKSRTGSHVIYSCHHNFSCFTFPSFVHSWFLSVFHSLQSIMPHIYINQKHRSRDPLRPTSNEIHMPSFSPIRTRTL